MTPLQNKPKKPASGKKKTLSASARADRELQSRTSSGTPVQRRNPMPQKPVQSTQMRPHEPGKRPVPNRTGTGKPPSNRQTKTPLTFTKRLIGYAKEKTAAFPYLLPEGDFVARLLICAGLILFFALLQTTVFARFRLFGVIPDLMLPLVIAVSMVEGEKWGVCTGLAAAFLIESLGSTGATLLPILYGAVGYFAPIVTTLYFTDSLPVRAMYTAVSGVGRAVITLLYLSLTVTDFHLIRLCGDIVLPEYAATCLTAVLPHLAVRLCLRPFHKSRAERMETL